ncbi:MAG TPA: hypothetical protein VF952_13765 [Chloroflexia bacterium]
MSREQTCVLREEENRWVGRLYEKRPDGEPVQYTFEVIPPLRFQQGHVIPEEVDTAVRKIYSSFDEGQSAMRSALHRLAWPETAAEPAP